MKVASWSVQGSSSPQEMYVRKTLFDKEWDVSCAIQHKCDDLTGPCYICMDILYIMQVNYHIIIQV